ncbi:MAG: pre-peptidase C-terminal domain-containing protein [Dongiaceae bacterium]
MAEITAADIAAAVDGSVTVFNPPPGGGTSASQRIFVFDGNLDVRLTSGVPVTGNFSGSPPGACGLRIFPQYTILVPDGASQLRIALTSNQDLDLFARFAQRVDIPSSIVADYSSRSSGGNETITVTPSSSPPLQAGKYFVLIANCSTSAATFSLTATVTGGAAADPSVIASDARPEMPNPTEEKGEVEDEEPVFVYFPRPAKSEQDVIEIMAPLWVQRGSLLLLPGNIATLSGPVSDSHDYESGIGQPTMNSSLHAIPSQGTQSFELLVRFDQAQNRFVAVPIDLGPATDDVYLILYGTGIRLRSSLGMVTARVGGVTVPVLFAGATPGLIGLDQINLGPLPRSLAGRGEVDVTLTVDGKVANAVRVSFR